MEKLWEVTLALSEAFLFAKTIKLLQEDLELVKNPVTVESIKLGPTCVGRIPVFNCGSTTPKNLWDDLTYGVNSRTWTINNYLFKVSNKGNTWAFTGANALAWQVTYPEDSNCGSGGVLVGLSGNYGTDTEGLKHVLYQG